ncbi:taste receptor type 2 member 4-like [Lithobates pipiens]
MNPGGYIPNHVSFFRIGVLALEMSTGLLMNAFLIFAVYRDFLKTKTVSNSYKILLGLAISNVCFGILMSLALLDYFCSLGIFPTINPTYIYLYLLLFTITSCGWFSASLGFFYFIKISDFKSRCFSWMKTNISSFVPRMLLVTGTVSLFNSLLSNLLFIFRPTLSGNTTDYSPSMVSLLSRSSTTFVKTAIISTVLPFLVVFTTTLFTVVALKKHRKRMKNVQTSDSLHMRSYENVVRRMTHCLLFYVIFYVVMIIVYFVVITWVESGFWLLLLLLNSFSPVQSTLLVLANPRLKAAWKEIFLCAHLQEMFSTKKQQN